MNYKDILAMASAYKQVAEASAKTRALQGIKAQPKDKVSLAKAPWEKEKEVKKEAMDPVDAEALKGKHKDRKDKDIDNDGDVDSSDEYLHKRRKAVSKAIKGKGKEIEVEVQTQESVELDEDLTMVKKEKDPKGGYIVTLKDKKGKMIKRHMKDGKVTDMKEEVEIGEALEESLKKHMSPYDAKEFLKTHNAHNKDFHTLPSSAVDAIHDKAKELKYKKSRTAPGSTGRMFHAALQRHADSYKGARESVELDENKTAQMLHRHMLKALGKSSLPKNHTYTSAVANNGDFVVHDGGGRIAGRLKKGEHDVPAKMSETVEEAKSHGNMDNGSPRGEGLSPSAKKELERTTPMNPATDELAVNNLNFKTFKAMVKKAPKRSADNDAGDKKAIASATSVKEELDLSDFTQEEIIDFMMTEDFAQLDELSKNTLSSYLKKAAKTKNATIDKADRIKYNNAGTGSEMAPRSKKALDKHNKTIDKRTKGIGSFMKRDQAKNNPEYVHKPSATDRYKDGSAPSMTNKPASALHKSYKDRK